MAEPWEAFLYRICFFKRDVGQVPDVLSGKG